MGSSEEKVADGMIPVFVMGRRYEVPEGLTIMKAMEYAGYQFIRGAGCRGGVCGACATVYRKAGDYKIYTGLACQTVVAPDMVLVQLPFYPANRAGYVWEEITEAPEEVFKLYPEVFRCLACNACTKVCPMDVEVMDAIAAIKRGDITRASELSFSCIQCGLCASRCLGELPQYHIFQLARRIYGAKVAPRAKHLQEAIRTIGSGRYEGMLRELMEMDLEGLKTLYQDREIEPDMAEENWTPANRRHL